ncbi:hypothetical protein [Aquimarina agarilytica]|uniref:hypothetical protein n=1 Tax=Aquimarina agarilytica TaxID=1087449 RepID=UPI00028A1CF1|nr:hypothetical protein [Aquimarina agarilytica]
MTIKQLQALDLEKVQPTLLQAAVKSLLEDYENTADKKAFETIAKENIEKVYKMVERSAPEALEKEKPKKEGTSKKESKDKATIKSIDEDLKLLDADIKACRAKIRAYNDEKRKGKPQKPKPTRHAKIKGHFISIANLIPPTLKENKEVQKEARKILLRAHRNIMNTFKMSDLRIEKGQEQIKEKFEKVIDKK